MTNNYNEKDLNYQNGFREEQVKNKKPRLRYPNGKANEVNNVDLAKENVSYKEEQVENKQPMLRYPNGRINEESHIDLVKENVNYQEKQVENKQPMLRYPNRMVNEVVKINSINVGTSCCNANKKVEEQIVIGQNTTEKIDKNIIESNTTTEKKVKPMRDEILEKIDQLIEGKVKEGKGEKNELKDLNLYNFLLENLLRTGLFINIENSMLYYYDSQIGIYILVEGNAGISLLKKICRVFYEKRIKDDIYRSIIQSLITEPDIRVSAKDFFCMNNYFMNFTNGIYSIEDNKIYIDKNMYRNKYFNTCIPINYIDCNFKNYDEAKKTLACKMPHFSNYLSTSLDNNAIRERLLFEIIGYCLSNIKPHKKIIILQGLNSSGKSVLLKFITSLLSEYNSQAVCNMSLKQLGNKFTNSMIETAKLVCSGELDSSNKLDMSIIKKISGGDDLVVEKKYESPRVINSNVKMIFCSNQSLSIKGETTEAMIKRLHTLYFPNEIKEEQQNPDLIQNILNERDYIVSISMLALREMIFRGRFTNDPYSEELCLQYRTQIPELLVDEFISDCLEIDERSFIDNETLDLHYRHFCNINSYPILSMQKLKRELKKRLNVCASKKSINGMTKNILIGVKIK
ncbi:phage/plasmid primase, P4 family [Terrisporobacter hibernicus]|uniref:SF3 helicase domain-containing protein n=1 Tax=Terrisporobacter hibernicus TaxID=2813371 RepID=A0AAX2ZIK8_9FIRM|nr:phage/plasmid primase, P4 family [Terrisporobacter hibernicus]UEL49178.1 hypothetical protein JW646_06955 [Terrisporobacter hibernicus]